jgi:hypothetical protein
MRSPSSPAVDAIEEILKELRQKKPGDLRQGVQQLLQFAAMVGGLDTSRAKQISKAAEAVKSASESLAVELRRAGLGGADYWSRIAMAATDLVGVRGAHRSMKGKQRTAAFFAVLIVEQCSYDPPSTTPSGNLHNIAWWVYREIFGPSPETKEGVGLPKACREVFAWHRDPRNPKYEGKFVLPGLNVRREWLKRP